MTYYEALGLIQAYGTAVRLMNKVESPPDADVRFICDTLEFLIAKLLSNEVQDTHLPPVPPSPPSDWSTAVTC